MLRTYVYERTYALLKYDPILKYPLCYDPLNTILFLDQQETSVCFEYDRRDGGLNWYWKKNKPYNKIVLA